MGKPGYVSKPIQTHLQHSRLLSWRASNNILLIRFTLSFCAEPDDNYGLELYDNITAVEDYYVSPKGFLLLSLKETLITIGFLPFISPSAAHTTL